MIGLMSGISSRRQTLLNTRNTKKQRDQCAVDDRRGDRLRRNRGMVMTMPDIRLVQNNIFPNYSVTVDWNLLSTGALDERQALATAIIVALGTDALVEFDRPTAGPKFDTDRGGWWGDLDAEEVWDGWPISAAAVADAAVLDPAAERDPIRRR